MAYDLPMPAIESSPLLARRPYAPRHIRFQRLVEVKGWQLKLYTISTQGTEARGALVDAALELAPDVYPEPAVTDDRHGAGFIIVHDAATMAIALFYWWQCGNELHQRVFTAPVDEPRALTKYEDPASGCVWELEVIDFERRHWLGDLLADPNGPNVERYLARTISTDV
jgi:hypothetical protein